MNLWNLKPGAAIRIVQTFRDRAGKEFAAGTILHFTHRDYVPYESQHTVCFEETTMYLCDTDASADIVENRDEQFFTSDTSAS
ncbi:MAG TPA: hypothetical protein VHW24_19690 [Bryobacteraceae bacterium]|jgi:hypothetical protein|nr:hypothetical protein [Bryobacteraceae bacterium]